MFKVFTIILSLFFFVQAVNAEVYTLWPKRKSSAYELDFFLKPYSLISEPVLINGAQAELKLGIVKSNIREILTLLKNKYPDAQLAYGGDSLLVKQKLPDGWHKRLLLICFGDYLPVLQVSMTIPPKLPRVRWPQHLVITSDGIPLRTIYFPNRNTWYGRFKTSMDPAQGLAEVTSALTSQGWSAMSGESSPNYEGRGEIFIKKQPLSVMLVNFSDDGNAIVISNASSK